MNVKIDTRFEKSVINDAHGSLSPEPDRFFSIPHLIHYLPGCAEHKKDAWLEKNPEFAQLVWDHEALEALRQRTPHLHQLKPPSQADESIVYASMLAYHYGGVVLTRPYDCQVSLQRLLGELPSTLLITFASAEDSLLDHGAVIASAKIGAFVTLFEYFVKAADLKKHFAPVFRDFIRASMEASAVDAIVCMSNATLRAMTTDTHTLTADPNDGSGDGSASMSAQQQQSRQQQQKQEQVFHADSIAHLLLGRQYKFAVHTDAPTTLSTQFTEWCVQNNGTRATDETEPVDVCLLDRAEFNEDAPVSQALATATAFQSLVFGPKSLILIGHCREGCAGMDMMLQPQLHMMKATEVYRKGFAAWQLA